MLKQQILAEMKVVPQINVDEEIRRRIDFIKKTLVASGQKHLVLGISGGVDSSTCGRLAQLAINELKQEDPNYKFVAMRLPYQTQADEADAQLAINFIQPDLAISTNIAAAADAIHQEALSALQPQTFSAEHADFAKGNVKARTRMVMQYHVAALLGGLVLGTDHSAENITGFFTKWGDGACDLAPLFGLSKRQVRQIAQALGAPEALVLKAPTADLEELTPGKKDEDALGITYEQLDDFLEGKTVAPEIEEKIINIYLKTQHKRKPIPTIYD
jgi:NAD+ synthase